MTLRLPDRLTTTLSNAGPEAEVWGAALPDSVETISARWGLSLGEPYDGGSWSLVLPAERAGQQYVLKLVLPDASTLEQIEVLRAAEGRGVVRLVESDAALGAMLLESLEPAPAPSWDDTPHQLASALQRFWAAVRHLAPADPGPATHKAAGLIALIDRLQGLADDRHRLAVATARALAEERLAAHDPQRDVFCHGDPHAGNLMLRRLPDGTTEPVLIDVDGIGGCEPEYDLGVILRSWNDVILPADDPVFLLTAKADELARLTGTDRAAILAWANIERVTSGLYLRHLGHDDDGVEHLDSASHLLG
ncbi:phosphotransferase [Aestuariimicrobium soli]|uniref:phosphotransferase n=1 Tax=Aestuariimicrobium soli TaxID=2035834 RepID=UPI003EBF5690